MSTRSVNELGSKLAAGGEEMNEVLGLPDSVVAGRFDHQKESKGSTSRKDISTRPILSLSTID